MRNARCKFYDTKIHAIHLYDVLNINKSRVRITCILCEKKIQVLSIIYKVDIVKLRVRIQADRDINFATVSAKERRVMSRA